MNIENSLNNFVEYLKLRRYGSVRFSMLHDQGGNLTNLLPRFGLTGSPNDLYEYSEIEALKSLKLLFWKDMAYDQVIIEENKAEEIAQQFISSFSSEGCQYYSNRDFLLKGWNPMAESTYDSGIIILNRNNLCFCLWFEDED